MKPNRRFRPRSTGAATVELALVLPALVTIAFIGADLSRAVATTIVVANSARTGAEFGAMNRFSASTRDAWEADVKRIVLDEFEGDEAAAAAESLEVEVAARMDDSELNVIEVTVRCEFRSVVSLPLIPTQLPIERTVVMRQIR